MPCALWHATRWALVGLAPQYDCFLDFSDRFPAFQNIYGSYEYHFLLYHGLCTFHYVAQPGDGVTALSPHIGPYDMFAIEYGYRWYGKETPEAEKDLLADFLSRHTDRLYKYSEAQDVRDAVDPRAQNEDLGR